VPSYITGLTGSGAAGYFQDQSGTPRLLCFEMCWGLPGNAGRWQGAGGGTWQQDFDSYFAARSSQGYTAWWGVPWVNSQTDHGAVYTDGRTWDGVYPFTINGTPGTIATGAETLGLNEPYWTRIDYMINSAKANGMVILLNLTMTYDLNNATWVFGHLSSTQANAYGVLLANRYPVSTWPNVQWVFDDDEYAGNADTVLTAMLTGIRSTGDTRNCVTMEQFPETNCHVEFDTGAIYDPGGFGITYCQWNLCYTYDPCYLAVEASYTETGTSLIPVVWGDGVWYGDTDNATPDYTIRRYVWWALASGARGINLTSGGTTNTTSVSCWQSGGVAALTSDPNGPFITSRAPAIISYFTSLNGWHTLAPDTSNLLVTAGRGTKSTNDAPSLSNTPKYGNTDNYVTASRTPDTGSGAILAVIYCGQHFSITIDQSKMAAGYGAKWVDPSSLALTTATPGSTYNSTPLGNNSAGNPDWVLVLASPPYATWTVI
jgi:hypothetical protein